METILAGFSDALTLSTLLFVTVGILLGYVVGVMPGLNRATVLALAIPLSFYITPLAAIAFLVGITKASASGGAVTAILVNIPGEPSSAPTCFDGYPLARQGKAEKALKVALYASVIGDTLATLVLIGLAEPLASLALKIGPIELTAILIFALTFIAALSGASLIKGLIAAALGLFVSTIGLDIETATPRLTFGMIELLDGVPDLAIAIGMLALSEMLIQIEEHFRGARPAVPPALRGGPETRLGWTEFKTCLPTIFRSSGIGAAVGVVPGLGATVGSFMAYAAARRASKEPESFGKGNIQGVAAAEAADNAVVPASLIPLFALGIPGNVAAAILIGAFTIHGLTPGPLLFEQNPRLVYGIYGAMILASLIMLIVGRVGLTGFAKFAQVPVTIVVPVVTVLCLVGAYLEGHGIFAVYLTFVFGVLGYVMRKLDLSFVTFLIGFLVGSRFELALRQSIIISNGDPMVLLDHPIALGFLAVTLIAAWQLKRIGMPGVQV